MSSFICSVADITSLNHNTNRVRLSVKGNLAFKAGQYLEIILPSGKACPFSIASSPLAHQLELHIRPTPGSEDSAQIERLIRSADQFEIRAPKGDCYLDDVPEYKLILVAASTGISQMKSILEFLTEQTLHEDVYLYWGIISPDDLYLDSQCSHWATAQSRFHYIPVLSEPDRHPDWKGRIGLVADALVRDFADLKRMKSIISGSPAMVRASAGMLMDAGMPEENIRSDMLSPRPID